MRLFLSLTCLICSLTSWAAPEVSIAKSPAGWELANGHIRVELTRAADGVHLKSLRREGGAEWAMPETPLVAFPDKSGKPYRFAEDSISDLNKEGKQLTLIFQSDSGGRLSLQLRLYPTGAVIQTAMQIENRGKQDLILDPHIDPLFLTLKTPPTGLKSYSSMKGQHGFHATESRTRKLEFPDWLVLENDTAG